MKCRSVVRSASIKPPQMVGNVRGSRAVYRRAHQQERALKFDAMVMLCLLRKVTRDNP